MDLLDNLDAVRSLDPEGALDIAGDSASQLRWEPVIEQADDGDFRPSRIVLAGMGGSGLAARAIKNWLQLQCPLEFVNDYVLPKWVNEETLAILISVSGNTEETISSFEDAQNKGARIVVMATGGKLIDLAKERGVPYVELLKVPQPRYGSIIQIKAISKVLEYYDVAEGLLEQIKILDESVSSMIGQIKPEVPTTDNFAKQLALKCVGKTPIIYSSTLFSPVAYKWKISFNENAKNTAWWNELPEFSHNEFIGWSSHPIEKPFVVIDLRSNFDRPRISERFELTDRLLSGKRPSAHEIRLHGESVICQMICGFIMADYVSIYLALLNGVDPTPVELVERLKRELS